MSEQVATKNSSRAERAGDRGAAARSWGGTATDRRGGRTNSARLKALRRPAVRAVAPASGGGAAGGRRCARRNFARVRAGRSGDGCGCRLRPGGPASVAGLDRGGDKRCGWWRGRSVSPGSNRVVPSVLRRCSTWRFHDCAGAFALCVERWPVRLPLRPPNLPGPARHGSTAPGNSGPTCRKHIGLDRRVTYKVMNVKPRRTTSRRRSPPAPLRSQGRSRSRSSARSAQAWTCRRGSDR